MNNNDVLRRLRYTFNFNDKKMVEIFLSAGEDVSREQISQWLKKDDDNDFSALLDTKLAVFLNGFINVKRGKKTGDIAIPEKRLTNNIILTKIKIALNLQAEDLILLLDSVGFRLNKPELSAFFRKIDHKHYRECKDQVLRNLLQAIDKKYHVERTTKQTNPKSADSKPLHNASRPSSDIKGFTKSASTKANNKAAIKAWVEGARPNASTIYVNPNSKSDSKRTKLKLSK